MKWISLLLVLIVVAGIVGISGCTDSSTNSSIVNKTSYPGTDISRGQTWNNTANDYDTVWSVSMTKEDSFSQSEALKEIASRKQIEQNYSTTIQNETKTLNGVTVYSLAWTRQHENIHREIFFFEKNGTWYKMDIEDRTGNSTNAINNEIATYMNKA